MTTPTTDATDTDAPALRVRALSHTYRPVKQRRAARKHAPPPQDAALDRVDLDVNPGEIFALLGPNGSGKSTLLRILATVQSPRDNSPDAQTQLFGHDLVADAGRIRRSLGVVFQHPALDLKLSAHENLRVHGKLYGLPTRELNDAIHRALEQLGMAERMHDRVESFSGGMRRRVEIAKALLTKPRLLMMDEASAGLDLAIQRDIWRDLKALVRDAGLTVLYTTHLMDEAELADRVAIMAKGRVVAVDTPAALVARVGGQVLEITPTHANDADDLCAAVQSALTDHLPDAAPTTHHGKVHLEHDRAPAVIDPLSETLGERVASFRLGRPTLADAYLKLTGQELADRP